MGDIGRDDTTQRLLPAANGLPIHSGFEAMNETRIIVAEAHGHWNAWFEDRSFEEFGGDTPGTAVERLWESDVNNRFAKQIAVAIDDRDKD